MRTILRSDAEANRVRLLEAGRSAIRARGLEVDVRTIANLAETGLGTFYRHFSNKDEFLSFLFEEIAGEFDSLVEDALRIEDPAEALHTFLNGFWEFGDRYGHSADVRQRVGVQSRSKNSWAKVDSLLAKAQRAGLIDPLFERPFLLALLLGVLTANYQEEPGLPPKERYALSTRFVIQGLAPRPAHHPPIHRSKD